MKKTIVLMHRRTSIEHMQDYGVNLICVEDGIDDSKEAGKLLISIIAAVAKMERENMRVQTMDVSKRLERENGMVESMAFPIISKEDWNLAQEKHSKNNYRREKIHNPKHAHILSGILNSYRLMWIAYMAFWKRLMNYMRKGKGD